MLKLSFERFCYTIQYTLYLRLLQGNLSAGVDGPCIQGVLEGEQECRCDDTLGDFRPNACIRVRVVFPWTEDSMLLPPYRPE